MSENKSKLYKKIHSVMKAIGTIAHDKKNEAQGYTYASAEKVIDEVRKLMITNDLIVSGSKTNGITYTPNAKGHLIANTVIEFAIADVETGETALYEIPTAGFDSLDKGVFKMITGAYKYLLRVAFMIEMTDDPEKESKIKPGKKPDNAKLKIITSIQNTGRALIAAGYKLSDAQKKILETVGKMSEKQLNSLHTKLEGELSAMKNKKN